MNCVLAVTLLFTLAVCSEGSKRPKPVFPGNFNKRSLPGYTKSPGKLIDEGESLDVGNTVSYFDKTKDQVRSECMEKCNSSNKCVGFLLFPFLDITSCELYKSISSITCQSGDQTGQCEMAMDAEIWIRD